jgi:hypothetical protein
VNDPMNEKGVGSPTAKPNQAKTTLKCYRTWSMHIIFFVNFVDKFESIHLFLLINKFVSCDAHMDEIILSLVFMKFRFEWVFGF